MSDFTTKTNKPDHTNCMFWLVNIIYFIVSVLKKNPQLNNLKKIYIKIKIEIRFF